ncbi:MAG TPA: adenylate/guanylate cyclase domain-containing protein [Gammaproteobacteria bacterium]|nr:adenylate/guanylate cyclase domain-containing protein [Gammaproteobacteria bacterium]
MTRRPALLRYLAAAAVAAVIAAAWHWRLPPLYALSLKVDDLKYAFQAHTPPDDVVFVAVDEASVNQLGRWPWDRTILAEGLKRLRPAGTVVLDMVFSEASRPSADRDLARSLEGLDATVCGFFLRRHATATLPDARRRVLARSTLERLPDGALPFPELPFAEVNTPVLLDACTLHAAFSTTADADGLYRRYPVAFVYNGGVYPSLSVQALRLQLERDFRVSRQGGLHGGIGGHRVAIDGDGMVPLNFYGDGAIRTVSFVDLLSGAVDPASLAGKVVVMGITEAGLSDIRATPMGPQPGAVLHATFLANVLGGATLRPAPAWGWGLLLVLALLPAAATHLLAERQSRRLAVYAAAALAAILLVLLAYRWGDWWLPLFFPLLGLAAGAGTAEGLLFRERERRARFVRNAFGAYLSPALVRELADHPERLELGGETRELTVLFSDIRGFTALSESLAPDELVALLNRFFTPVTEAIQAEGGYVDKYIGDAVMALFNAPVTLPDHADAACRAARRMEQALQAFNAHQREQGQPTLDIGIGIHTGEAVVGNMGSAKRLNYTALGDSVNVASRLEGLTKEYGRRILITEVTRDRLQGEWPTEFMGSARVKGREQPVSVFALETDIRSGEAR